MENQDPTRPGMPEAHPDTSSAKIECTRCRDSGWIHVDGGVKSCECRKRRIVAGRLAVLPPRFRNSTFANFEVKCPSAEMALRFMRSEPTNSFFIYGQGYGIGKTHLLAAQFHALAEQGQSGLRFIDMRTLTRELRTGTLHDEVESETMRLALQAEPFHLFLDDIDKYKPTVFQFQELFGLFDALYRNEHSLSLTSNLTMQELADHGVLDDAIVRRIDDLCRRVDVGKA